MRGKIVTIVDARSLYSNEESQDLANSKVIIFERDQNLYGMIVDSVENIISFSEDDSIKLPDVLYRDRETQDLKNDVRFAIELEVGDSKKMVMVLNLEPFTHRLVSTQAVSA